MAKYLRYMGEFLSRAGVVWRVEILQEAEQPFDKIGSLTFEADEPLTLEWSHTEKEAVICGSIATLRIESPGDRTYEDLYTVAPGRIRMDVYRKDALYWSGALDPEFYEEPYERAANYPVSLTFSDFGVLDRLKYDLSGMCTLREIVNNCINRAGVNSVIDESLISTSLTAEDSPMSLTDLKVRSDNFYDEDGEASSLKEVLEGVLQPLALRMVQRAGRVYIYDLNALYNSAPAEAVEWDGDSQTMSTDKVYNNAKITWSPYAQSGELLSDECYTQPVDETDTAINNMYGQSPRSDMLSDDLIFSYPCTLDVPFDAYDIGFSVWLSKIGQNAEIVDDRARFYKIVPCLDGQESEGVAVCWPGIQAKGVWSSSDIDMACTFNGIPKGELSLTTLPPAVGKIIFKSKIVEIPKIDTSDYGLRISLDMLMDCRFNPFESNFPNWEQWLPGQNLEDTHGRWNLYGNIVYVPVTIQYRENGTGKLWIWSNREYVCQAPGTFIPAMGDHGFLFPMKIPYLSVTYGQWVENTGTEDTPSDLGYISYYQPDSREEGAGAGQRGWVSNRQAIPSTRGRLGITLNKAQDGQYIPYPNFGRNGGQLWIEVRDAAWNIVDVPAENMTKISHAFEYSINDRRQFFSGNKFNWLLFKLPQIEIKRFNLGALEVDIDDGDVEYKAEINADAKEDIGIDTICGSSAHGVPLARGAYFNAKTGRQITTLTRAGRTTQIEDLLIGTLFSQFAERRTTLSGEMRIADKGLGTYSEVNQKGKKFMITSDTQDVIADVSDAVITELRPDEYKKR